MSNHTSGSKERQVVVAIMRESKMMQATCYRLGSFNYVLQMLLDFSLILNRVLNKFCSLFSVPSIANITENQSTGSQRL